MKNLFLTFTCILFTLALVAQSHDYRPGSAVNEKDRNVQQLASQINTIAYSTMDPDHKEARIMGIMGSYLSKYQAGTSKYPTVRPGDRSDRSKTPADNTTLVKGGDDFYKDCDSKRVRQYLNDFKRNQFLHIPSKYLAQLGDVNKDCALAKAVKIYNSVGYEYLSSANICEIIGCSDDDVRSAPKSRGAGVWQYTGVKRFFTEEDDFGWRYLCEYVIPGDERTPEAEDEGRASGDLLDDRIRILEREDQDLTKADDKGDGDAKSEVNIPGLDTNNAQWRTQEEVDRW